MREAKRRSIKQQTGENAVKIRLYRRSLEQKTRRDDIFCRTRQGLNESSLDPVVEEAELVAQSSPPKVKDARLERLQRWKEEKKLKAKLKSEKIKPFRITKVTHSQPVFLFSEKQVNGKPITASATNAMNASMMRVTRSKVNTSIQPKAQPERRMPPARVTKSLKPLPEAVVPAKKASRATRATSRPAVTKPQPCEAAAISSSPPDTEAVTVKREPSFAPLQFAFTAPSGVSPFFFQPTKTNGIEKLLLPLSIVSSVSPTTSNEDPNKEADFSEQKTGNEVVFKTPHAAVPKHGTLTISPALDNNPWICVTRGKPPSSKKSTPRKSRNPESNCNLPAVKLKFQPIDNEDSEPCPVTSPLKEVEHQEMNACNSLVSPAAEEPIIQTPSRQLRSRTSSICAANRSSSGLALNPTYFRNLLNDHTRQLKSLCSNWQVIMESEKDRISENVTGKIRTTIGQSELLMAERFKQFSGLIDDCELGRGEKVTTCVDLQGFWEMIFYQVEDVKAKFTLLDTIKSGNWEEIATPVKPAAIVKRPTRKGPKPQTKPNSGAAALAARQRLADAKAKAAQLRKAAMNEATEDQASVSEECSDSLAQSRVQQIVPEAQSVSNENVSPSSKCASPRQRRSRRSSLQAVTSTVDEPTSALLVPVPVLESLNLNSPVVTSGPGKRLSELYSPLRRSRKGMLETIDDEDSELTTFELVNPSKQQAYQSTRTPEKRVTRSSNLMRFSVAFPAATDESSMEKENADLVLPSD